MTENVTNMIKNVAIYNWDAQTITNSIMQRGPVDPAIG